MLIGDGEVTLGADGCRVVLSPAGPIEAFCPARVSFQANWLSGAVETFLTNVLEFRLALRRLHDTLSGRAVLYGIDPDFELEVAATGSLGSLAVRVGIGPDPSAGETKASFTFDLDQSYLPGMNDSLAQTFPVLA